MVTRAVERRDDVRDYFIRHAVRFDGLYGGDNMATRLFDGLFRRPMYERYRLTIEALGKDAEGKRYLDVGCGSGRYAVNLARLGAKVVGVDFSGTMLRIAQDYAGEQGVSESVQLIQADMDEWMESSSDRFDAAFAMGVFDYLADPVRTLKSMLRLADKAYLSIPAPEFPRAQLRRLRYARQNCPLFFYTREDAEKLVRDAGGRIVRMNSLGRSGFFVVAEKA